MKLKTHSTSFNLLSKWSVASTVTFTIESNVHWLVDCGLDHSLNVNRSRSTCSSVCTICRASTATYHCCDTTVKSGLNLLWTNPVDMSIDTTSCNDHAFSCDSFCRSGYYHVRHNAILDVRVTSFTDTSDLTIFDTDISFNDAPVVNDNSVCKNIVKSAVSSYLYKMTRRNPMVIPVITKV